MNATVSVVTGATGYSGKYITRRLLARGQRVISLTNHPQRPHEFGSRVAMKPYNFDRPAALVETLRGVDTLYNTYWVRFDRGETSHARAVAKTQVLFQAAKTAGVRRLVHISIANPSLDSPLPYYHGKAVLEQSLRQSGLSYAILRPTVIFGPEDILINNIAYFLRRFPVFAVPGDGQYFIQPIFVEDLADMAVDMGGLEGNAILDATSPEIFTFNELLQLIAARLGRRVWLMHLPPGLALRLSQLLGLFLGDVLLTADEVRGLMANLLASTRPPTGDTLFSLWLKENAAILGRQYHSELVQHYL